MNSQEYPLVSVVINFYNTNTSYLSEAINSVLNQTYPNIELLLIDDGSTESNTIDLAKSFVNNTTVQYRNFDDGKNHGRSAARNLGISYTKGTYLIFLDSDDVLLPDFLSQHIFVLQQNPNCAMVFGPIIWWYSWDADNSQLDHSDAPTELIEKNSIEIDGENAAPSLLYYLITSQLAISGMTIRKSFAVNVGGFEDKFKGLYDDQVFCAKMCAHFPAYIISEPLYLYRQHAESCTGLLSAVREDYWNLGKLKFLTWLNQYLKSANVYPADVRHYVNRSRLKLKYPVLGKMSTYYNRFFR